LHDRTEVGVLPNQENREKSQAPVNAKFTLFNQLYLLHLDPTALQILALVVEVEGHQRSVLYEIAPFEAQDQFPRMKDGSYAQMIVVDLKVVYQKRTESCRVELPMNN
jgi:hypothetical protein